MDDGSPIVATLCRLAATFVALAGLPAAADTLPEPGVRFRDCTNCPEMVVVPSGEFLMGKLDGPLPEDPDRPPWLRVDDEFPVHRVSFERGFALARTPVTVAQFAAFAAATGHATTEDCASFTAQGLTPRDGASWQSPPFSQTPDHPVTCVSWLDAHAYASWLALRTGQPYRLPSEAEWEYAARAGAQTPHPGGKSIDPDSANYGLGPSGGRVAGADRWEHTSPVGSFPANPFGLTDMQGNVLEWLADCYAASYEGAPENGQARNESNGGDCRYAMLRGGSWSSQAFVLRLSNRDANARTARLDQYGFRVARDLETSTVPGGAGD